MENLTYRAKVKQGSRGFTLIELLISLSLSIGLILVATQAFRLIASSVEAVEKLHGENMLMAHGMLWTIEALDYYKMEASQEYPYYKFHESRSRTPGAPYKRWFAPVVYSRNMENDGYLANRHDGPGGQVVGPVQNPNVFLPHDQRSIYRNGLFPGEWPSVGIPDKGDSAGKSAVLLKMSEEAHLLNGYQNGGFIGSETKSAKHTFGDYGLNQSTSMAIDTDESRFRKINWDGSEKGQTDMSTGRYQDVWRVGSWANSIIDAGCKVEEEMLSVRSRAIWQLHQHLGHFGVANYIPKGMPWLIVDQHGCYPRGDSLPTMSGEVSDPLESTQSLLATAAFGKGSQGDDIIDIVYSGAADWASCLGAGSTLKVQAPMVVKPHRQPMPLGDADGFSGKIFAKEDSAKGAGFFLNKDWYYQYNVFRTNRVDRYAESSLSVTVDMSTFDSEIEVSVNPLTHPVFTRRVSLVPASVADQVEEAYGDPANSFDNLADELFDKFGEGPSIWRDRLRNVSYLDSVRLEGAPALTLEVRVLRYHIYDGNDMNIAHIVVGDRSSGRELVLSLMLTGTDYRGARQHYGAAHLRRPGVSRDRPWLPSDDGHRASGDFYVD